MHAATIQWIITASLALKVSSDRNRWQLEDALRQKEEDLALHGSTNATIDQFLLRMAIHLRDLGLSNGIILEIESALGGFPEAEGVRPPGLAEVPTPDLVARCVWTIASTPA